MVNVRLPVDLQARLDRVVENRRQPPVTRSSLVRDAIEFYLNGIEPGPKDDTNNS
jgi:metal-responsive CopG/Arc/MetJ family transcriptional regulator